MMLSTGLRYAGLRQVLADPDRFDDERGTLPLLTRGKREGSGRSFSATGAGKPG